MKFKDFLISLFKDERGNISIKPIVTFLCVFTLIVLSFIDAISKHDVTISKDLISALVILAVAGLGGDTWDKFSFKNIVPENKIGNDNTIVENNIKT